MQATQFFCESYCSHKSIKSSFNKFVHYSVIGSKYCGLPSPY